MSSNLTHAAVLRPPVAVQPSQLDGRPHQVDRLLHLTRPQLVLVQNQATSKSLSMPAATIATGHVDAVLPPRGIATALISLAGTGNLP